MHFSISKCQLINTLTKMQSIDEMESKWKEFTFSSQEESLTNIVFSSFIYCINMKFDHYDSILSIYRLKKIRNDKVLIKGWNIEQKEFKLN